MAYDLVKERVMAIEMKEKIRTIAIGEKAKEEHDEASSSFKLQGNKTISAPIWIFFLKRSTHRCDGLQLSSSQLPIFKNLAKTSSDPRLNNSTPLAGSHTLLGFFIGDNMVMGCPLVGE
jgi:hypothetical protein